MTTLNDYLIKLKIPDSDRAALVASYGSLDADTWIEELEIIATALDVDQAPNPPACLCDPWRDMWHDMHSNPGDISNSVKQVSEALGTDLHLAITGLLGRIQQELQTRYQGVKIGSRFSANRARRLGNPLMKPPDPKLVALLEHILTPTKGVTASIRHSNAESALLDWLNDAGKFIRTPEGDLYYLWHSSHTLYELDTERWHAWLHQLTCISPATRPFSVLANACKSAASLNGELKEVVRLAYFDTDTKLLWVSRFDGRVYCLDGDTITLKNNGDGPVIFDDLSIWQPYEPILVKPDKNATDTISTMPKWQKPMYSWAYKIWTQSIFFTELCPTRPILVMLGEKGSGKSMALRLLLRLLFGEYSQVSGVPDKPDAFSVTAAHYHLYAMDNLDTLEPWLQDKLARIATGAQDEYRKLYTSKEMGTLIYRCWIAVTARTPDTLRRDDLADRLLLLQLGRVEDIDRRRESLFLSDVDTLRSEWWGRLLHDLNAVVKELQTNELPITSPLRMADWEALGRLMSIQANQEPLWDDIVAELKKNQDDFLAEGDVVIEAIDAWLNDSSYSSLSIGSNLNKWVTARELHKEAQKSLFGLEKPDSTWPRSVRSFGRRIMNVKNVLEQRYGMEIRLNRTKSLEYWFDNK